MALGNRDPKTLLCAVPGQPAHVPFQQRQYAYWKVLAL